MTKHPGCWIKIPEYLKKNRLRAFECGLNHLEKNIINASEEEIAKPETWIKWIKDGCKFWPNKWEIVSLSPRHFYRPSIMVTVESEEFDEVNEYETIPIYQLSIDYEKMEVKMEKERIYKRQEEVDVIE